MFRNAYKVSSRPEMYGVDFLWSARGLMWGVQRKKMEDLIASVHDGRLAFELGQMRALDRALLVIVGRGQWTLDGFWAGRERWSRAQQEGLLWHCMERGVWVDRVETDRELIGWLEHLERWSRKDGHVGLVRPGAVATWGTIANDRDWLEWFLQGLPGIGGELAKRIVDKWGNPFGLRDGVRLEDVEGIGKKKAERVYQVLGVEGGSPKKRKVEGNGK